MGGRGTGSRFADTSYQGAKGYAKAAGKGITVDNMAGQLSGISTDTLSRNQEAVTTINNAAGNPNAKIVIYRATIGDSINAGDWVFLD